MLYYRQKGRLRAAMGAEQVDHYYEQSYSIGAGAIDLHWHCRPSALLTMMQEAATDHADILHISRRELEEEYHAFWMLARVWFRLARPLALGERLLVRTWHRGGKGATMYRDFDLLVDGAQVGEAVSLWVMADLETHRLCKLSDVAQMGMSTGGSLCKDIRLSKLRMPEDMRPAEERRMHYSDTDVNGHVNNARYADFACDALALETLPPGAFVSAMQIGYVAECRPGESLALRVARGGEADFVHGVGPEGDSRFDAAVWYGGL